MTVDRKEQQVASVCSALLIVGAGVMAILGKGFDADLPREFLLEAACLLGIGGLTAALAAIHASLGRFALEEIRSATDKPQDTIFDDQLDDMGRHQQALHQFEKVVLPPILCVLSLLEAGLAIWIMRAILTADRPPSPDVAALLPAASVLAVISLILFIPGKYVAGIAFGAGRNYLRPVAGVTLLGAITAAFAAIAALISFWGYLQIAVAVAWVGAGLSCILAVERMALWLVDMYRPHAPDQIQLPVYESRILALFSRPRGVLGNLSDIIEYQFGLRINDKVLATSLHRIVAPLLILQLVTLLLLTSLVYVAPHQTGVIQQWGASELKTLPPGLHVRLPWPAASVTRVSTGRIAVTEIGIESMTDTMTTEENNDTPEEPSVETWLDAEFKDNVMLTAANADAANPSDPSAISLATVKLTVHHRIANPIAWVNNHIEPKQLLVQLTHRELGRLLLRAPLRDHLADGGRKLTASLVASLQTAADNANLGAEIIDVRIRNVQPPANVALAWEEAYSAKEIAKQSKLEADRFAVTNAAGSTHRANKIVETARAETVRTRMVATTDSLIFAEMRATYQAFPELHKTRAKMDALERALEGKRKIIIAADAKNTVYDFDLKKARPDLLESLGESE